MKIKEKFEDKILKLPPVEVQKMHPRYGRYFRIPKIVNAEKKGGGKK